jgi:hypothetical protein
MAMGLENGALKSNNYEPLGREMNSQPDLSASERKNSHGDQF